VNLLDVALIALLVLAILGGLRLGLVARLASWIGLVAGILLATWTVPYTLALVAGGEPPVRFGAALLVVLITVTVTTTLFQAVGARARSTIARTPLSAVDRGLGAVAGGLAVLAVAWFVLPVAAEVPGSVARQVRGSAVLSAVETLGPPPPQASRAIRPLVDHTRFPEVLADLQRTQLTGPPPEQMPVDAEVIERASASTVNLSASGCGQRYEGSGFTVATDTVVTNAHVVAGADQVEVRRPDGHTLDGQVVVFDPDRDLAILRVPDLGQEPLPLASMAPGDEGVSIGYPAGQHAPRVAPIRVDERRTAVGRDIYGHGMVTREILDLSSAVQRGDSGGPFVTSDGQVAGVVFAANVAARGNGYALTAESVRPDVENAVARNQQTDTGRCRF
jgi:S1-C subfamily serine protease